MAKPLVLFVDDEPHVLDGLRTRLHRQRREWDLQFVASGRDALAVMAGRAVDIIISDLRMPEMDGATLLSEVCRRWPRVTRIAMSGQADGSLALRAAGVSHQFISKPSEPGVIEDAITRVCELREAMSNEAVLSVVGRIDRLPPVPAIYTKLVEALADESVSSVQVGAIVKQDVAMSAKVLQMVNSAFFRLSRTISTVDEAVVYLGFNTIRHLSLAAELFGRAAPNESVRAQLEAQQDHALRTAAMAAEIARNEPWRDDAFVAGLLHDVGKLVLLTELPAHLAAAHEEAERSDIAMHVAERDLYGVTHAQIGGYLLGLWGLPESVVEAVTWHHSPDSIEAGALGLPAVTHIANGLVSGRGARLVGHGKPCDGPDPDLVARLGLTARLPEWLAVLDACDQGDG